MITGSRRFVSLVSLMLATGLNASAHAGPACYLGEIDPRTEQVYASKEVYSADVEDWAHRPRPSVGPIDLVQAYSTYRSELGATAKLRTDKAHHCFIGCVIALKTSPKVSDYVGWWKEQRDLSDCDPKTHFEEADAVATSNGARLGARDRKECISLCRSTYNRRRP